MKTLHAVTLAALALGASQWALAEEVVVSQSGEAATRGAAMTVAQKNLNSSCATFGGVPVPGTTEVVFEKVQSNGKHWIDARMKCNLQK